MAEMTNDTSPLISLVVPVYNSTATLEELTARLHAVLDPLTSGAWEIVFVNDGSRDESWAHIGRLAAREDRITGINLTRNFGQHNSIMCGIAHACGRYVITLDDDLQNPPEEIPKLLAKIEEGYDVVYGVFEKKKHSLFRNFGSELVQWMYRKTFNTKGRLTSFRIIDRDIAKRLLEYGRSFTFIDGLISWNTSRIGNTVVEHHARASGRSGYSNRKLLILALNMATNFSIGPLQVATIVGILFSMFGFIFGFYILLKKILMDIPISGYTSTIVTVAFLSGVQLLTVGVLGEYIGRIHINVSNCPQYVVRDIIPSRHGRRRDP
ncbi:glycosyltransferase family 2 protein [bacterium]|nr:glycosyltransferase family 2 protein [bacterium]MBU1677224.1 glycosyltransferase family 2 protein [bacterium]